MTYSYNYTNEMH